MKEKFSMFEEFMRVFILFWTSVDRETSYLYCSGKYLGGEKLRKVFGLFSLESGVKTVPV